MLLVFRRNVVMFVPPLCWSRTIFGGIALFLLVFAISAAPATLLGKTIVVGHLDWENARKS